MKRLLCICILVLLLTVASAQTHGVIADIETGLPIRDVKIYTNTNKVATTNWLGDFTIYTNFQSATISHGKYMAITLKKEEMTDTIYMLPKMHTLEEVVVWGKRPHMSQSTKKMTEDAKLYSPGGGLMSFDFFSLFKKSPMNRKQRKKHEDIIKNY